jgi:integrase
MFLTDVRSTHIRAILEQMLVKPRRLPKPAGAGPSRYSRGTLKHVRAGMFRLFDAAWRDELIESNPVARVRVPAIRETRKERMILTDDEFHRFIACAKVDLELRMAALAARCEGGMRTRDCCAGIGA